MAAAAAVVVDLAPRIRDAPVATETGGPWEAAAAATSRGRGVAAADVVEDLAPMMRYIPAAAAARWPGAAAISSWPDESESSKLSSVQIEAQG